MGDIVQFLSRDQIKAANDITYDVIQCPEWGGQVRVRTITATEREKFGDWASARRKEGGATGASAQLAILAVVDAAGQPVFTAEDAVWLTEKCAGAVGRIADHVLKANAMLPDSEKTLGKDSAPSASDASPSA